VPYLRRDIRILRHLQRTPNARCPRCNQLERHRAVWLYLRDRTALLTEELSVLHVAPERPFRDRLSVLPNLRYICGDLNPKDAGERRLDVTELPFDNEYFDLVLCNHVLEHVPDDRVAMRELFRVLAYGGRAIMQHSVDYTRAVTFEDDSVTSPPDRKRVFGQHDHVRIYGRDIDDRLEAAGFEVQRTDYARQMSVALAARYGLVSQPIHDCRKRPLA
jgi:SAM-dependent methyltransferase